MDKLIQKISDYLQENPNSTARNICKEIGADKSNVNSCLYSNEGTRFFKEGLTPPLWRNVNDSSGTQTVKTELTEFDDNESEEDFEIEDDESIGECAELTEQNSEEQQVEIVLKTLTVLAAKADKKSRRPINQLINQIQQSIRNEASSVERAERKLKNRAENVAMVDAEINEVWNAREQRVQAIAALHVQFEANLRRLAYGYLISSREEHSFQLDESENENYGVETNKLVKSFSSTIDTRLSNLENMTDEDLVRSTVRFGWFNQNRVERSKSQTATEMVPQFEEIEEIKIYRSRFQKIVQRINGS